MGTNPAGCGWDTNTGTCNDAGPIYHMLPFIEQQPLWSTMSSPITAGGITYPPGGPWPCWDPYPPYQVRLSGALCPSDGKAWGPHAWNGAIAQVNYAFSRGDKIENAHVANKVTAPWGANWVPRGVFQGDGWGNSTGSCTTIAEITDGTSNTIAISEMAVYTGIPSDVKGGYCIHSGLNIPAVAIPFKGLGGTLNCVGGSVASTHWRRGAGWNSGFLMTTGFQTVLPPNAAAAQVDVGEWNWGIWPPQSYHPGGVNGGFCDGSVRFISDTINTGNLASAEAGAIGWKNSPYGVWGAMGSISGGEPIQSN